MSRGRKQRGQRRITSSSKLAFLKQPETEYEAVVIQGPRSLHWLEGAIPSSFGGLSKRGSLSATRPPSAFRARYGW